MNEIPFRSGWQRGTVGLVIDGWTTLAGGTDLRSDNQRVGKGGVGPRSQQKYSVIPDYIETDPNKVGATAAEMGSNGWNEALVDNWKVKSIVVPDGIDPNTLAYVKQSGLPIIDRRSSAKQQ